MSEAHKRYQEKNPVIRIDIETYDKLMKHSEKIKKPIKFIIKESTTKYLDSEVEQLKKENDLFKKEVEQLRIENDLLKVNNSKVLSKEKKGLKESLKDFFK